MEDGFPHGTREGYQKGCHSKGACMGPLDGLPTCVEANMRYSSDYGYRKRVDAGDSPQAIAEADRAAAAAPKTATPTKPRPAGVTVEQSVEPLRESEPSGKFMSDEEVALMLRLHSDGLSDGAIARELGRAQANISRQLRKRNLASNGRTTRTAADPQYPPAVVQEPDEEVRGDGALDELADARAEKVRLQTELDTALSDVSNEKAAREGLALRVAELTEQLGAANEDRSAALQEASTLRDRVATLTVELDVAKSPDALPSGAELAPVPSAPVAAVEEVAAPVRAGSVGLDIQQVGDALSVRLHGGEPVHLNLQFNGGALSDVGVKIGA
jgi:hypothetical protein